jgi:hypothetical protein
MMDPPFDVHANIRRLICLLSDADEARLDGLNQRATHGLGRDQSAAPLVSEDESYLLFILSHL